MDEEKKARRKLTTNEWVLIGMLIVGLITVALRWEHIGKELAEIWAGYTSPKGQ